MERTYVLNMEDFLQKICPGKFNLTFALKHITAK